MNSSLCSISLLNASNGRPAYLAARKAWKKSRTPAARRGNCARRKDARGRGTSSRGGRTRWRRAATGTACRRRGAALPSRLSLFPFCHSPSSPPFLRHGRVRPGHPIVTLHQNQFRRRRTALLDARNKSGHDGWKMRDYVAATRSVRLMTVAPHRFEGVARRKTQILQLAIRRSRGRLAARHTRSKHMRSSRPEAGSASLDRACYLRRLSVAGPAFAAPCPAPRCGPSRRAGKRLM